MRARVHRLVGSRSHSAESHDSDDEQRRDEDLDERQQRIMEDVNRISRDLMSRQRQRERRVMLRRSLMSGQQR